MGVSPSDFGDTLFSEKSIDRGKWFILNSGSYLISYQLSPSSQAPRQVKAGQNVRAMGNGGAGPARRSN